MKRLLLALLATIPSLLMYVATAAPSVYGGDSGEFQRVAFTLGLAHSAYPEYLLLGHAWIAIFPFGEIAWKMNILSSLFSSLTVGMVAIVTYKLTGRWLAAAGAAAVLATSSAFWSQSVVAGVRTYNTLLIALILWVLLSVHKRTNLTLPLFTFLLALGFAHHRLTILIVPGIITYFLVTFGGRKLAKPSLVTVFAVPVAFLLGLTPYLFTYFQIQWPSLNSYLYYLLFDGGQFASFSDPFGFFVRSLWPLITQQFGVPGLILLFFGLLYLLMSKDRHSIAIVLLFGLAWVVTLVFFLAYPIWGVSALFPQAQMFQAILIGLGLAAIIKVFEKHFKGRLVWAVDLVILLALALPLYYQGEASWQTNDLSKESYTDEITRSILADVGGDAVLFSPWGMGEALLYQTQINRIGQDITVIVDDTNNPNKFDAYLAANRRVYFWDDGNPDLGDHTQYQLIAVKSSIWEQGLSRVLPGKFQTATSTPFQTVHLPVVPGLTLEGYRIDPLPLQAGQPARLTLYWSGNKDLLFGQSVILELDNDHKWLSQGFRLGSELDSSGSSNHGFFVPLAPFSDVVKGKIKVYKFGSPDTELAIDVGPFPISAASNDINADRLRLADPDLANFVAGNAKLLRLANDRVTSPGIAFPVTAYWQIASAGKSSPVFELQLVDPDGKVVNQHQTDLSPGYPIEKWPDTGVIAATYSLNVPRLANPGLYTINFISGGVGKAIRVGQIQVEEPQHIWEQPPISHPSPVEFANGKVRLLGYDLAETPSSLTVTLHWKAVETPTENWKAFVQVLDGNNKVVAQNDSFPSEGLRWTDTWKPNEYIIDRHVISLPATMEKGQYAILIGMYNPESGLRVPVNASAGTDTRDAYQITTVSR